MFGKNLRRALERRAVSQTAAAELLQIRQPSFNYYCNLVEPPRDKTVRWLSFHLGIPCDELLGGPPSWLAKGAAGKYGGADPLWWNSLKRRWRRRNNRSELELSIRVLFPDNADAIVAWLNGNNPACPDSLHTSKPVICKAATRPMAGVDVEATKGGESNGGSQPAGSAADS
jgi:hypothetical protein